MTSPTQSSTGGRLKMWMGRTEDQFEVITIFRVPESLRGVSREDHFEPQELRVGLFGGPTSKVKQMDGVKERLALLLSSRLDWDDFVSYVVPNVEDVQVCYEMDMPRTLPPPSTSASGGPCDLQERLTLDSLFLVLYLHATNDTYVLEGSQTIFANLPLLDLDLIQLENQVPMDLLRLVIGKLKLESIGTPTGTKFVEGDELDAAIDNDLDTILKQAVRLCYPFVQKPIIYPKTICQRLKKHFQKRSSTLQGQKTPPLPQGPTTAPPGPPQGPPAAPQDPALPDTLDEYLNNQYHGSKNILGRCAHILECVYHVICGHKASDGPLPFDDSVPIVKANEVRIIVDSLDRTQPAVSMERCSIRIEAKATTMNEINFYKENSMQDAACWLGESCYKSVILNLPQLKMDDNTAAKFRNLAIYEQRAGKGGDLRSYLQFMSELVNNAGDAELLRKRGVIKSLLGSDDAIVQEWRHMCDHLMTSNPTPDWIKRLEKINKHCKVWYYRTRKECIRTYCSTPGLSISIVVLCLIFVCTLLQTWVSVTSSDYMKPSFKKN